MASVTELETRQAEIRSRIQEINVEHDGEAFPDEARSEWNTLNEELETNGKLLDELESRSQRVAELSGKAGSREDERSFSVRKSGVARGDDIYDLSTVRSSVTNPSEATREMRDRAMRATEAAVFPPERANREDCQSHIGRLLDTVDDERGTFARLILTTGSPTYKRAFGKAISGQHLTNEEQRAMSLTGASGGFAVPFVLDPTVLPTSNGVVNPLRQVSRVISITVDEWRGVSSAGVTASYGAEAAVSTDNSPTLVQPTISTEKARAFVPFSIEIGGDWPSFQSEMGSLFQIAKDELEGDKFFTGSGTNEPFGVLTGASNTVNTNTTLVLAAADIYKLEEALPPRYRPTATIMASKFVANKIRQLDTAGGASLWTYLSDKTPNQLIGYDAYEASALASSLAIAAKEILIGDFSRFVIVDRLGMTVELIPHIFGAAQGNLPTGQRGLFAYWRNGSKVVDANAFRLLLGL